MAIRLSADWMVKADDRILEYLDEEGPAQPLWIANDDRIPFQQKHVNVRLLKLAKAGLCERDQGGRGIYAISEDGQDYLRGKFDARDVAEPN